MSRSIENPDLTPTVKYHTALYTKRNLQMEGSIGSSAQRDITALLVAWRDGDQQALTRLVPVLYAELRHAAHRAMRRRAGEHTLQTTALVNETYLKLAQAEGITCRDRAHFLAVCAQTMRRILVDDARSRLSAKRGGGEWRVQFDDDLHAAVLSPAEILRLHDALTALAQIDVRKSKVVELRFFGGLTVEETAAALGISRETALRDWRFARAWLRNEMTGTPL